ncbi:MAG: hypothetical protein PHE43_00915 [Candidatus Nanoarchaeia archaeon]|nr:hypothetical protein [Candidatus Nanoarchaeia archaeon]
MGSIESTGGGDSSAPKEKRGFFKKIFSVIGRSAERSDKRMERRSRKASFNANTWKTRNARWNALKGIIGAGGRRSAPQQVPAQQSSGPSTTILKQPKHWGKWLIIIGIIVLVVWMSSGFFSAGTEGISIWAKSNEGIQQIGKLITNTVGLILHPEESFGSWTDPSAKTTGPLKGVEITQLESNGPFYENYPVSINGKYTINGVTLNEGQISLDLKIVCELEDYDGKPEYTVGGTSKVSEDGKYVINNIIPNEARTINSRTNTVICNFPDGIKEIKNNVETKAASLNISYDSHAETEQLLFLTTAENENIEDVFYEIKNDPKTTGLLENDLVKSVKLDSGPVKISIGAGSYQPFTIQNNPLIMIKVEKEGIGAIEKIKSLKMNIPRGLEMENQNCGCFENDGTLKKEVLDEINKRSAPPFNKKYDGNTCMVLGDNINTFEIPCKLKLSEEPNLNIRPYTSTKMTVTADYTFNYQKSVGVMIKKIEEDRV